MSELRIRMYNVHFGDGILVTIPDGAGERHLLIDVGNLLLGKTGAGDDALFGRVLDDILLELDGAHVDLYVLTHEHLDHAQGLVYADVKLDKRVPVDEAWLTASADPHYYETHPDAEKKKKRDLATLDAVRLMLGAKPDHDLALMLANNDPRDTDSAIEYLRDLHPPAAYVHRGTPPTRTLGEATITVLAPEEDTTVYSGSPLAVAPGAAARGGAVGPTLTAPPGVDVGAFADLLERRGGAALENLLEIDKANNNTSVVLLIEWRGWRMLFPGDAEQASWWMMGEKQQLGPVHVLKVGHHGSWNGTPPDEVLEQILPMQAPDLRPRFALLSTHPGGWKSIPNVDTLDRIRSRATLHATTDANVPWLQLTLRDDGTAAVRAGP